MSSGSLSVSLSVSGSSSESADACCFPVTCACESWLTAFCEYVTVTLTACGEEYQFDRARATQIPSNVADPNVGVYASDKIFRLSMLENSVEILPGATILDAVDVTWQVYRVEDMAAFCVKKLWARSVQQCFQLTDNVEIYTQRLDCEDCGDSIGWDLDGLVKGTVICQAGNSGTSNDVTRMSYRYVASLEEWPLGDKPKSIHMLRTDGKDYRILSFTDAGPYVPFVLSVEPLHDNCEDN